MADIVAPRHEREQSAAEGEIEDKPTEQPSEQPYEQPYPPSWLDRLMDWAQQLPGPAWLFYLGVGLMLVLARTVVAWGDGSVPVGTFFPTHILLASTPPYLLFVLHYLDDRAGVALSDFRPVLTPHDANASYERLHYELTSMPARPTLIWSLTGLVWGVALPTFLLPESQNRLTRQFTSPAASVIDYIVIVLSWVMGLVFVYHTTRQLGLISRIYTQHTSVNIFGTGPLYALSRVAGLTTIALLFLATAYIPLATNWRVDDPLIALTVGVPIPVALVTFVWPLFGAHRLLQQEKARWKGEIAGQMEVVARKLNHQVNTGDMRGIDGLKDALNGLIAERGVVDKVPTWPWEPEVVRGVLTALLLPIAVWGITRVLARVGF